MPPVSITTFAGTENPFAAGKPGDSAHGTQSQQIGIAYPVTSTLLSVRKCDRARTACTDGIAKVTGQITVEDVKGNEATISVSLTYDLGRRQVISSPGQFASREIPADIPALNGNSHYAKIAIVPFGQMRRVELDHGVNFDICVLPINQYLQPIDDRCSVAALENGKISQAVVTPL